MPPKPLSETDRTQLIWFFCLFGALLVLGALGVGISRDWYRVADYFGYIFPIGAAIVGGLGIYFEAAVRKCFWWSAGLLCAGLLFYLFSKHVPATIVRIAAALVAIALCLGLLIEGRFRKKLTKDAGEKDAVDDKVMNGGLYIALPIFVIISALMTGWLSEDQPQVCEITIAKPTTAKITNKPQNKLSSNEISGGISRGWDLEAGTVITLNPCHEE